MVDIFNSKLVLAERTEMALYLSGIVLATGAAYYLGQTGDPAPVYAVIGALSFILLLAESTDQSRES